MIETHPQWIPGNFGNKQHSSLALAAASSRGSPRAQSADRSTRNANSYPVDDEYRPESSGYREREIRRAGPVAAQPAPRSTSGNPTPSRAASSADYDVLASRAAPNRAKSATPMARSQQSRNQRTVFDAQTPRSSSRNALSAATPTHSQGMSSFTPSHQQQYDDRSNSSNYNNNRYRDASVAASPDPSAQLLAKSMSDMTVAEIRAALLSMPAVVRQSLVQTPPAQHNAPSRVQPSRRGSYEDSQAYTPGNNNRSSNFTPHSVSMTHEEYLDAQRQHGGNRRNSEQYERFMGESYPAVGEFYPAEHEHDDYDAHGTHLGEESSAEEQEEEGEDVSGEENEEKGGLGRQNNEHHQRGYYDNRGHEHGSGQRQRSRERHEYSAEQKYGLSYETTTSADAASDSEYPQQQKYDREFRSNGDERDYDERRDRNDHRQHERRQAPPLGDKALPRSDPASSTGGRSASEDYSRVAVKNKPQLPEAAKRGRGASPSRRNHRDGGGASDRESRIPRPAETSPRTNKYPVQKSHSHRDDTDGYDSSIAPSRGAQTSARSRSAQRMPARNERSHSPQPAWGSNAPSNAGNNLKSRAASTGSAGDSGRPRYLPEAERKQALEWSRKQAWEKKVRSDFSGSPLRSASPSNAAPVLKLKYRSFHSSVEKDTTSSIEDAANGKRHPRPDGRPRQDLHIETGERQEASHKPSALEKDAAVQEAVGAIARSRARAILQGQAGQKSESKSEHINYSANAFSKKPESFFAFRNNRTGAAPFEAKDPGRVNETSPRNASPPLRPRPNVSAQAASVAAAAAAAGEFVHPSQLMQAGQQARRSPERTDRQSVTAAGGGPIPSTRRDEHTMTNVAEWRRLTEWLTRIGMQRYIDVLRANGVTKLSLVELMVPEDMQQIGIAAEDIAVIHSKVTEFTNRTRSFSEQVLNRGSQSPDSLPNGYPPVHTLGAAPVPNRSAPTTMEQPVPQQGHPSTSSATSRPRPNQPPPHLHKQPAGHNGKTPFAQRNNQSVPLNIVQNPTTFAAAELSDGEGRASEPVLESARIAAEEHIFSDVREIRTELLRCFETGERELFFHAWKQLTLYMPDDCNTLNPLRPSMFNAKQVMEFHLHLHFAVFPITHNLGKKAEKQGKLALRRYLESIMLTSELDSLNQLNDVTPRSALAGAESAEKSTTPNGEERHALLLDTNLLNMTTASSMMSPNTPFTRTREYAVYAGMVLVPDPQENVAFQALFQPQWMQSLKERLGQFLTLVSPNVEILPTLASTAANSSVGSVAGAAEDPAVLEYPNEDAPVAAVPAAVVLKGDGDASNTSYSSKVQVRTYLEPAVGVTPPPSSGRLDDFEIAFTSPVNHKHGEGLNSPMPSDMKFENDVPLSPIALEITSKMMEDVVSPLEMSPSEADVPRKRIVNTKLAEETASYAKLTGIASPVSAVSSVISQLTDDDGGYLRSNIAAAAAALKAEENIVSANRGNKSAEKKPKLKPFSSASKSAMQSQVDVYNKLLKRSASPKVLVSSEGAAQSSQAPEVVPVPESPSSSAQAVSPAAFRTTRRAAPATTGLPRANAAALNVGFGLKRRPASDSSNSQQVDQSLAAQVARYNMLLVSSNSFTADAVASEQQQQQQQQQDHEVPHPSSAESPVHELPSGRSEDTAEEMLSASEAHRVEEVLLEMQHIYNNTTGEEVPDSTSTAGHLAEPSTAPALPLTTPLEQVEQKMELHGLQVAASEEEVEPLVVIAE